ncbi:purine-cytosine permease family protein [Jatrophihabitans sp. YIM 134969]
MSSAIAPPDVEAALASYGSKTVAVEPGGVEFIPLSARHGKPSGLFWTWTSPNMEFATITVGILSVLAFGLTFWQAVAAIVIGNLLGSTSMGLLSTWGPRAGLPQMVLSRTGFGFLGNILPAGINAIVAGVGWFAVNSVSGALALHALATGIPAKLCLVIVVVLMLALAFAGHNLVHAFERYAFPVLTVVFVVGAIWVFAKANPGAPAFDEPPFVGGTMGGFLLTVGATFGYAAGWNPYASDYTRYLAPETPKKSVGLAAGLGVFVSCVFLEVAGAAMVSAVAEPGIDPGIYTSPMPTWLGKLTLLAITIGAIAANALNLYSASMSFMALGIRLRTTLARAGVSVVFAIAGLCVGLWAISSPGNNYENFLLIISYWIGPWLGVVFLDRLLHRRTAEQTWAEVASTRYQNWAGPIAMLAGIVLSIWLFSNQTKYTGVIPSHEPKFGDIAFFAGFLISATLYTVLSKVLPRRGALAEVPDPVATATA